MKLSCTEFSHWSLLVNPEQLYLQVIFFIRMINGLFFVLGALDPIKI